MSGLLSGDAESERWKARPAGAGWKQGVVLFLLESSGVFWKRRKQRGDPGPPVGTLLGTGSCCEGKLQGESPTRVEGYFKGGLSCCGRLVIGTTGEVEAEIDAAEVYVNGQVRGVVRAERVELGPRARLVGDITTHRLAITAGACFHGVCRMREERPEALQAEPDGAAGEGRMNRAGGEGTRP